MPALQHRQPPAQKPGIKFTGENRYTRRMISVLRAKVGLAVRGFSAAKTTFNCRSIGNTGSFVCLWDCAEISCFNRREWTWSITRADRYRRHYCKRENRPSPPSIHPLPLIHYKALTCGPFVLVWWCNNYIHQLQWTVPQSITGLCGAVKVHSSVQPGGLKRGKM